MFMEKGFKTVYIEKLGLLNSRKINITLYFRNDGIVGSALKSSNVSGYTHQTIECKYDDIQNYCISDFDKHRALKIETCVRLNNKDWYDTYFFPFESAYNIEDIIKSIDDNFNIYKEKQEKIHQMQAEKLRIQQEREEQERAIALEQQTFFDSTYSFHIKENTPVYIVNQKDTDCFAIYVNEDKSINFLLIEARSKTEIHSFISYNDIHYYEKAGNVHFATSINAHYQGSKSFGGSFAGGKVSAGAAALGGLLFGPMGMAMGSMLSYKPAEYTPPITIPSSFDMSSEITKIDERSVILNYYSEQHKQYMDIELPQDIYNFMQTYLPDKKYAIVIEKEKQNAVAAAQPAITANGEDTSIQRLTKLKQLYEMELITETEYLERKKEILAEI